MIKYLFNLQMFAEAGTVTNTTSGDVNSYTGEANETGAMSAQMKVYYNTEVLENAREVMLFGQLGTKQTLPAGHGNKVEWRKFDTLPDADKLQEGVIPEGRKMSSTSIQVPVEQYGQYVSVSDVLELQAIDPVILLATEEVGYATGLTYEKLVRGVLQTGSNVLYADIIDEDGKVVSTPATRGELAAAEDPNTAYLTPRLISKASTILRKANAPAHTGSDYVAVVHHSVADDLRNDPKFEEYHKYEATEEIFAGEIGKLAGVRFIASNLAPVVIENDKAVYTTFVFGRDAFGVIDPEGGAMETIIKDKRQTGGPLNQFSTIGAKFMMGAAILYPERMLAIETLSSYSDIDEAN